MREVSAINQLREAAETVALGYLINPIATVSRIRVPARSASFLTTKDNGRP